MGKIKYPYDLQTILQKMYDTGKLYQCLRTGVVLDVPISRVWKGNIKKTSFKELINVIYPWASQWDEAQKVLCKYGFIITHNNEEKLLYRIFTRVTITDVKGVFQFLGKEKELQQFLEYEKELSKISPKFVDAFYSSKQFREQIYSLYDNLSNIALKEEEYTPAEWTTILLHSIIKRCKNRPKEVEHSRNVELDFLDSKFLEQNISLVRKIYNLVFDDTVKNQEELAKKMNISFGDPVFYVNFNNEKYYWDIKQLNEKFNDFIPEVMLISENKRPIQTYDFNCMVIGGVGWAIGQLFEKCPWVQNIKSIYYWGDCDMAGYGILNMVRGYHHTVQSLLMDNLDKIKFTRMVKDNNSTISPDALINLTTDEMTACKFVKREHIRIEQERIEPEFVKNTLKKILV